MKTNFERAEIVIEKLLPRAVPLVTGDVDTMVTKRLRQLSTAYGGGRLLAAERDRIDYSRLTTQIAYAYRSLSAHGDWVYKSLCLARAQVRARMQKDRVHVSCIGGGPGSDILGVMKFADSESLLNRDFLFKVLDCEKAWRSSRDQIISTFDAEASLHVDPVALDLADGEPWTDDWSFAQADLFTFSFSLSEVWSFNAGGSVSAFIQKLLDQARKGAIFCYVDNGGDGFTPQIEAEFSNRADIALIGTDDDNRLLLSGSEQAASLMNRFKARFGNQSPKLTGNVTSRIWQKT